MRANRWWFFVCIFSFFIIGGSFFVFAASNSSVIAQANIIGEFANEAAINIEVSPTNIDFDDVEVGQESDEVRVNITNLGNVDINVVPMLKENSKVFENLIFQKRKTGNSSSEFPIGQFSLNILAPSSDEGRKEYCYVKLDLEDVDINDLDEDDLGNEQTEIIFVALSAE